MSCGLSYLGQRARTRAPILQQLQCNDTRIPGHNPHLLVLFENKHFMDHPAYLIINSIESMKNV